MISYSKREIYHLKQIQDRAQDYAKIQSDGSVQQKCDALRKELDEKEK